MKEFYGENRKKVFELMPEKSLAVFLCGSAKQKSEDELYPFCPDKDFMYLTGLREEGLILVLTKQDGICREYLFISRPDPYQERYFGKMPDKDAYSSETGIEEVDYLEKWEWTMGRLIGRGGFRALCMDFSQQSVKAEPSDEVMLCRELCKNHPYLNIINLKRDINNMRRFKTADELELLQKAVDITGQGIQAILKARHAGINESVLQAHFEFACRINGGQGNAFAPIVAGGERACALHYDKNNREILKDQAVLLDLGAQYEYYCADISRTYPIEGRFTEKQEYYYNAVLESQKAVISSLAPGFEAKTARDIVTKIIAEYLIKDGIISDISDAKNYVTHGICHYIGLDTHDVGDMGLLEKNMVVTCEPGVYIPELGLGIRIEDDVLITEKGCRVLSEKIPKEIEDFC